MAAATKIEENATADLRLVNRLSESRSPYVRGHMDNPVAWQMWGPEAIAMAKENNRLMFVSIGYAACHWCHVMERESFMSNEIASILNNSFIPVKIDREERPDVDRIYMNYVQATTGSGGWPLNVFLTPDLEPVFGGTYWPGPNAATAVRGQHVGFLGILGKIRDVWSEQQERCVRSAKDITAQLKEFSQEGKHGDTGDEGENGDGLELDLLEEAYQHFQGKYDKVNGGFAVAPKFPTPVNLAFLLRLGQPPNAVKDVVGEAECKNATSMAVTTLRNMARGGIHDHIGHGFARYSVTRDWSLPHFEKMLYDQAQLLNVYLDAYLATKDPEMLSVVHDIATYLTTPPLASSSGGYFSAEDADSLYRPTDTDKREGAFYVWTRKEFETILGERAAEVCAKHWDVRRHGNVSPENDAHDEFINQNVLAVKHSPAALSKEFGLAEEDVASILKEGREKLREHRERERPRPNLDDKIVVSWNGLAIGALARVSAVLLDSDPEKARVYRESAEKAVAFIRKELYDEQTGRLRRVFREGPGDAPGFADDYAFLIQGLIELYEATFDDTYLQFADRLQKTQITLFWDTASSAFYSTEDSQPDLILRLKDGMDSAEPSTNGISAQNLYRLSSLLDDEEYLRLAGKTVQAFEAEIMQHPFLFSSLLVGVVCGNVGMRGVVVCGEEEEEGGGGVQEALRKIRSGVSTNGTLLRLGGGAKSMWLRERNGLLSGMDASRARVQICEGGACREEAVL
ncbi:MAG: hypothetical protein M1836_003001 [Candelina mexicana]|nr:MAG: hypothetical protein M1836_003001 [Candelina mexicana]